MYNANEWSSRVIPVLHSKFNGVNSNSKLKSALSELLNFLNQSNIFKIVTDLRNTKTELHLHCKQCNSNSVTVRKKFVTTFSYINKHWEYIIQNNPYIFIQN